MLLRYATLPYPSIERSKYSNCTDNLSKYYGKENQGIQFHHHCQAHLICYFGQNPMPLLMHLQNSGRIRIIYQPDQTRLTQTLDNPTQFQPWLLVQYRNCKQ